MIIIITYHDRISLQNDYLYYTIAREGKFMDKNNQL